MKICTIIGARPQFIKAAAVSAVLAANKSVSEVIIHTGQHYDPEMSDIFFRELKIPREKYNLAIGSGPHGEQTGKMLMELERVLLDEKPDWVLLYGDTNSTASGALAAVKLQIPVAHEAAGMRSFNRKMPEEINRIITDHISTLNFCSTQTAVKNLFEEGRRETAFFVGDVMYDLALQSIKYAEKYSNPFEKYSVKKGKYILMTCHRAENTDCPERLSGIVNAVNKIARKIPVLLPLHPRTKKYLSDYKLNFSTDVKIVSPLSYFEMILLEKSAKIILTDSGGIQKEAFFYKVPCITMRDETEWLETLENGWNIITGADYGKICEAFQYFTETVLECSNLKPYGDGKAAAKILKILSAKRNV